LANYSEEANTRGYGYIWIKIYIVCLKVIEARDACRSWKTIENMDVFVERAMDGESAFSKIYKRSLRRAQA